MNKGFDNKERSLSKSVFLSYIGISLVSLILIGSFWFEDKIRIYKREIQLLQDTYVNNKKEEIKSRVLQLKDHIFWIRDNPLSTVSSEMTIQFKDFFQSTELEDTSAWRQNDSNNDARLLSVIPFYVLNKSGQITFRHNPDNVSPDNSFQAESIYNHLLNRKEIIGHGITAQYSRSGPADSALNTAYYYNSEIIPGNFIVSIIRFKDMISILQWHILDSLSKIRFLEDEYFFVNSYDGKALISNGRINIPPINIYEKKDTVWQNIFKIQKLSKSEPGGLYYTYKWPKISKHKTATKTSFFSFLPEWRWIIGTGFYEDDVHDLIQAKRKLLIGDLKKSTVKITILFLISVIFSYGIIVIFSRQLEENIKLFSAFFHKAAHESDFINSSGVHYKEFKHLAVLANRMVEEQRSTKNALHRSEEKFIKAFQNSPNSLVITSLSDGLIIEANKATTRISGYSYDEIIGQYSSKLNFWKDHKDRDRFIELLDKYGRIENFEADLRMKSGVIRKGLFSAEVIEVGSEKFILSVIVDITEKKLTEELLRNRERILSLIYSHVQDAIYLVEVESDDNFRFLSINQTFLDLTGLKEEQIVTKLVTEIIPEPSLSLVINYYKQAIEEKRTVQWEETSQYPAGIKTGMVTITPLFDSGGNCKNLVGTVHDITERKKAEDEIHRLNLNLEERILERTAQLSLINRELESFSYSISHDLRTPLRAINGFSQILVRRHRSSLDAEGRQYLDYIVESSSRMEQLICDLLNYSRLGRKSVNIHPVLLGSIMDTIHNDFKEKLDNIGASFIIASDLPAIQADESLMQQILSNLVDNAIKYRRNEVPLEILINCERKHNNYYISISDNGIGIADEYLEKIFDIFQRLHSEEQYPGTGIGLATVKKAVSLLNGTIEVKSSIGKGSTFIIILPEP
jgi:PAS domain S-box-containing protein